MVYKCQLEDFFINDSEHDIKFLVYLPFKQAILVAELFARALIVLQKHAFDEDVDKLNVEARSIECLTPKQDTSSCENTHVVEHSYFYFSDYKLFTKNENFLE